MLAPQPRPEEGAEHTYFLPSKPDQTGSSVDFRDPRVRHLSRITDDGVQVDKMKVGARIDAPTVSAGIATPLLVFSGIAIKMLVDQRLDAALLTMFLVEYQPGGVIHPHDHPFEETYYILDGEVDAIADGKRYVLTPGDVFRREVKHFEMVSLKVLWSRVEHWYRASRGKGNIGETAAPHKRGGFRKIADGCWDRFEKAAEKVVQETTNITGPEIEQQQFRRKPPKPFKEAA
jgi:mannose-6-phosphate isomerase-like protein (cupin superfamily)